MLITLLKHICIKDVMLLHLEILNCFFVKSMRKRILIRHISFLLLTALLFAIVPFHQIFHKHNFSTETSKTVQLKKTEKSCCSVHEALFGTTVSPQHFATAHQPVSTVYHLSYFSYFIKPLFELSNKAPPVSLV